MGNKPSRNKNKGKEPEVPKPHIDNPFIHPAEVKNPMYPVEDRRHGSDLDPPAIIKEFEENYNN